MRGCFWRLHGTVEGSRVYLISVNDDLKVQTYPIASCLLCEDRVDASHCGRARSSLLLSFSSLSIVRFRGHVGDIRVHGKHVLYSGRCRCLLGLYVPHRVAGGISSIACGARGRAAVRSEVYAQ